MQDWITEAKPPLSPQGEKKMKIKYENLEWYLRVPIIVGWVYLAGWLLYFFAWIVNEIGKTF